ncbi:glycosyltransferase family 4 protein [Natrialbaceae archaeon AArc-T1-2]|uniref:glycosyltransferase family 4 protein n=1 Tax=Natrialbaceae archaeon AArc-T1-2 TaxID=3053904 RepID=UPI00255ADDFA|nr:glycosyltransferase family 4 protein [Natrialbaceae archaeon AArc-T1-2]WIV67054.1 glycosyltransferase family 4 protein [Natrialbaceae archaeon AArc-T1-2]
MRIGFYHDSAGTRHAGGIAVYTQHVAAELAADHEVYVYTQTGEIADLLARSDAEVVTTPSFTGSVPDPLERLLPLGPQSQAKLAMTLWGLRNGLLEHVERHVDVLITYQFLDDLLLSHLVDVPTIYGIHGLASVGLGARARERLSRTDWIVANSTATARTVSRTFGYEVDAVVPPGVDETRFRPDVDPAFSSDRPTVLFVGRLVPEKGIFDLLEAFARLDEPAELRLVGAGETPAVRKASRDLGIGDDVILEGEVSHLDLPGYYTASDVFCLPSHTESFGMANLEAMACGTPIVTSELEAIEAYADDDETGYLVQVGDVSGLADRLSSLVTDSDRRERFGKRARERALEYTWEAQAERLESFCADVLEATGCDRRRPTNSRVSTTE